MEKDNFEETEQLLAELRRQVISRFDGMTVDMNYILCIPSIHAAYGNEDAVVDCNGVVRRISDAFPVSKSKQLSKWARKHKKEIQENHSLLNSELKSPNPIDPPAAK